MSKIVLAIDALFILKLFFLTIWLQALQAEKRKQSETESDFAWLPEPVKVVGRDHFNVIDDVQNNYILQVRGDETNRIPSSKIHHFFEYTGASKSQGERDAPQQKQPRRNGW